MNYITQHKFFTMYILQSSVTLEILFNVSTCAQIPHTEAKCVFLQLMHYLPALRLDNNLRKKLIEDLYVEITRWVSQLCCS